ncbi:MAG TPA: hypothetical protein PK495_04625 [Bacteroidales bacterium]|nr:hypothetical protein [Bacteroidales bacterium]
MKKVVKTLLIVVACIISLFLGVIIQIIISPDRQDDKFYKKVNEVLRDNNEFLDLDINSIVYTLKVDSGNTTDEHFLYTMRMLSISNYFKDVLSSQEKTYNFSLSELYTAIGKEISMDELYEKAKEIDIKKLNAEQAELFVNICKNWTLREYMSIYYMRYLISYTEVNPLFVSKTDTLRVGEVFETDIHFEIKGLAKDFTMELEDGSRFTGSVYKEVATKKGLNVRKGRLWYLTNMGFRGYPFEFYFYVEW